MPHSRNGALIEKGAKVSISGTVIQVFPGAETCNIVVEHDSGEHFTFTASKCDLVTPAPTGAASTTGGSDDQPPHPKP